MLERVKLALRINHTRLDTEISSTIEVAKAELIRLGISAELVEAEEDSLICEAIKTYCLFSYANDDKRADGYFRSCAYS